MDYIKSGDVKALFERIRGKTISISCWRNEYEIRGLFAQSGAVLEFESSETSETALRENFNPLKRQQDIIVKTEGKVYNVPYLLLKHAGELGGASKLAEGLSQPQKAIFSSLMAYGFTKDLKYLNEIIKSGFKLDLEVFKELSAGISEKGVDLARLTALAEILRGTNATCGQVVDKLKPVVSTGRKNVIFIHLESISNEVYYNNLDCFPNIAALMSRSLHLKNFYSSASSSAMAITDLFYGNDFENDRFPIFEEMKIESTYCRHLFEILQAEGYEVLGTGCNENVEDLNRFSLWNFHGTPYEWTNDFEVFTAGIDGFLQKTARPFAMHIWNVLPHIGHNNDYIREGKGYSERMRRSYELLDETVKRLMETLEALALLEDTVIIAYGDHGDDKWTRAMNSGFTHITAPYLNIVKTPALILDSRIEEKLYSGVVSMVDLKATALYLAGIPNTEDFPHQGINIFEKQNEYAYSRSLLTNQREEEGITAEWIIRLNNFSDTERKSKAFNIIGRDYNLLVSNHGTEFFFHAIEPGNYNNLLDFLETDENGDIVRFNNRGAWRGHFRTIMMEDDQLYDAMYHYYTMRELLMKRIALKNSMINCDERNLFDMGNFKKARARGFDWD